MAAIDPIYNGESGASVRDKLNELIDTVNSGSTTINVGDAPLFDPNKAGGYEAGSIVSYRNEASPDPAFQEFAIYVALADIAQGVSPEDSASWKNEGASLEVAGGSTANGVVQNITRLRELTGMRTGHSVIVRSEGAIYIFDEGSEAFVKPFAPGIGSWRKSSHISLSNVARVFTAYDAAEGDEVMCPLFHTIINFATEGGNVTIVDDSGNAALGIVFAGACIVRRVAEPLVLASFEVTPLDSGGGHTIYNGETLLPQTDVLNFDSDDFEVTDEGGQTVVRGKSKAYTIDFGTTSLVAQEINMFRIAKIVNIVGSNINTILLTYSGGLQQPISLGINNIDIEANDILTWEITRINEGEIASLGIKLELNNTL